MTTSWRFPVETKSVSAARDTLLEWARREGLPAEHADGLRLALGEAIGNAVVHGAGEGHLEIRALREPDALVVELESPGAFQPREPATMPVPSAEHGRGRALMAALLDSVEYLPSTDRTIVRMRRLLPSNGR